MPVAGVELGGHEKRRKAVRAPSDRIEFDESEQLDGQSTGRRMGLGRVVH